MDIDKGKKSILDILDAIELNMLQQDIDYAQRYLAEEGMNLDEERNFALQQIKSIQFKSKAMLNKQRDQSLLEVAYQKLKSTIEENAHKTTDALMELLQAKNPSIQYRKLDNWTDDEIREVLSDIDLIALLEELDKHLK